VSLRCRPVGACWLFVISLASILSACSSMPGGNSASAYTVAFTTDEGTWMSVDVAPGGETIVFDLLGDLYLMPIEGGRAIRLTEGASWDSSPRYSASGREVYFISDRVGFKNVWAISLETRNLQQITDHPQDVVGGLSVVQSEGLLLAGIRGEREVVLHIIDTSTGSVRPIDKPTLPVLSLVAQIVGNGGGALRPRAKTYAGTATEERYVYFSEAHYGLASRAVVGARSGATRLFRYNSETRQREQLTPVDAAYDEYKPQLSHDGELLAYFRQYLDGRSELRVRNLATDSDRAIAVHDIDVDPAYALYTTRADSRPHYAFTPGNQYIVYWMNGKIHCAGVTNEANEILPFEAHVELAAIPRVVPRAENLGQINFARLILWPGSTPDKRYTVLEAVGYVWVRDNERVSVRRITNDAGLEAQPALSPDGKSVAYIKSRLSNGRRSDQRLMIASLATGEVRELYFDSTSSIGSIAWSRNGSKIALVSGRTGQLGFELGFYSFGLSRYIPVLQSGSAGVLAKPRAVGFDFSGQYILYSYQSSDRQAVLAQTSLNGRNTDVLAIGDEEVGTILPSPDSEYLAVQHRDKSIWLIPRDKGAKLQRVSLKAGIARKVRETGGNTVSWDGNAALTFSSGSTAFSYDLAKQTLSSLAIEVPLGPKRPQQVVAYRGARLLTVSSNIGTGPVINEGTIIVQDGRIAALGDLRAVEIPKHAIIVDVSGMTIMPGLVDSHYHTPIEDRSAIEYGITSAWTAGAVPADGDPFSPRWAMVADMQISGRLIGPRWSYAGGHVGQQQRIRYPETFDDLQALARLAREHGVQVIKEYNSPTRKQSQWIVMAARENRLGVVSHLEDFESMMTRVLDGYTGGDHSAMPTALYRDARETIYQSGYIITPHLVIPMGIRGHDTNPRQFILAELAVRRPDLRIPNENPRIAPFQDKPKTSLRDHYLHKVGQSVARLVGHGAEIGVSGHNAPGFTIHEEMWHLWKGGVDVEEVLRSATSVNAKKLGLDSDVGSLEPGKLADFLILDENPLDDILNTLSIQYTIQAGVIYDANTAERITPEELQRRLAAERAANDDDASLPKTGTDD